MVLNQGGCKASGNVNGVLTGHTASTSIGSKQWDESVNKLVGFVYLKIDLEAKPSDIGSSFTSTIKCTSTGKFLTVDSNNNVVALSCDNSNKQKWKFTKNSDNYYEIENVATGLRLDVDNAGTTDDTNIQVYNDNDSSAQRWGIYGSQGSYVLKPKYSSSHVLDSDGGNNNVHLWTYYTNLAAQKFTIVPDPSVKFDTFSVTNLTSTDARVKCKAYKPASAKAVKYGICYAPSSIWGIVLSRKSFYSTASTTNVGNTYREIYFDFVSEVKYTLSPNTEYGYYFIAVYDFGDGETRTYTSDTKSFVTKSSSNETHTHSYTSSITTSATCTTAGVRTYKCSCGSSYTESIAALGHSYGSWSTATSATCTSGGKEKRTCSRCGNS
ncbi:MAG: RICIN domain-containing protein, partial [Ruminiclostridium sp.]